VANRAALDALIVAAFATLDLEALAARLTQAGIAFGRLNGIDGLARHPQLRRLAVESEAGPIELIAPPLRWSEARPRPKPIPALAEHAASLRAEFGEV
jgi:crotonobetainyl-CoA:carnitine CoA-transferase CaiB-like acyl-CoA transferase